MPTDAVCTMFDELKDSAVALLELKKHADKIEHDLKVAIQRRNMMQENPSKFKKRLVLFMFSFSIFQQTWFVAN